MSRHRSVLDELRPPRGWWATQLAVDVAPAVDTSTTAVDAQRRDGTPAVPNGHNQAVSDKHAGGTDPRPPQTHTPALTRRLPQSTDLERCLQRERDAAQWMEHAACRGCGPALFFPTRGESTAQAKAVCASCPVQPQCLEHALQAGEKFGTWGGKSER